MDDSKRALPPERERTEDGPRPGLARIFRHALRYFRPYAWPSALILLTLLLQTAFRSLVPIGYQQIFDRAILERNLTLLVTILGLLGVGWVVQAAASLVQDHASARAGYRALPFALFGPKVLGSRAQWHSYRWKQHEARVAASIQEVIGSHAAIRTFGLQQPRLEQFRRLLAGLAERGARARFAGALAGRSASQSVYFVQILTMGLGA